MKVMKVQSRLRELREAKNITQEDLSKATGLSRQSISNWEIDFSTIHVSTAIIIADYFDVPLDYLVGRVHDKQKKDLANLFKNADHELIAECLLKLKK